MHQYISSARYTLAIDAALKRLEEVLPPEGEEVNDPRVELLRARQALAEMTNELPTPGEAFDNLVRAIESRFTSLERDAWRNDKQTLAPAVHANTHRNVLEEISAFCANVISNEGLGATVYAEAKAALETSGLLVRMGQSFESDGLGGEYRSDLTDTLMEELRTTLSVLVSEQMGLDLALEQ